MARLTLRLGLGLEFRFHNFTDKIPFLRATALYATARYHPTVCPFVCLSVRRVDHRKKVEVRMMKFSPHGSPIPLVFAG